MQSFFEIILKKITKKCEACGHKMAALSFLQHVDSQMNFCCPSCLKKMNAPEQERQQLGLLLLYSIVFIAVILQLILPIVPLIIISLLSYRFGLTLLPLAISYKKIPLDKKASMMMTYKKMMINFLSRACPNCQHQIDYAQRIKSKNELVKCGSCSKILRTHPRDELINSFFLAWFIHQMTESFFGKQIFFLEIFAYIAVVNTPLWRQFQSMFSLIVWPHKTLYKRFL